MEHPPGSIWKVFGDYGQLFHHQVDCNLGLMLRKEPEGYYWYHWAEVEEEESELESEEEGEEESEEEWDEEEEWVEEEEWGKESEDESTE